MKQTKEQKQISDLNKMLSRAQARVSIYQSMVSIMLADRVEISNPTTAKLSKLFDKLAQINKESN